MKFKFHWGWAIGVFYTSFVAAMVYFVIYSKGVDHSLVKDNYYDYDIGYEKLIGEKKRNSSKLNPPVQIKYNKDASVFEIDFPSNIDKISGEIWLYRANNEKLDKKIKINVDNNKKQFINAKNIALGKWKISVDWVGDSVNYLDEQDFYLN